MDVRISIILGAFALAGHAAAIALARSIQSMRAALIGGLAVSSVLLSGCATITRGSSQAFTVESNPSEADVRLSTGETCSTPCTLRLKRKRQFVVTVSKEGYQTQEARVHGKVKPGSAAILGNAAIGGLIGAAVDVGSGSLLSLSPNWLKVTLVPNATASTHPSQNSPVSQQYRIAKGDKVKINTFGEDRFSGEFVVHGDGKITFPLFGGVPAAGSTSDELAVTIASRLAPDYLREPQVTAEVISFRPVHILGEVAKPGQYPYVEGMTMYALIAQAGGHSYRANRNYVYVRRDGYTAEHRIQVLSGTPVQPGDTIRIPQRIF